MVRSHLIPIIIAGPTASKKSKLAIELALKHGGEIICADSRQFYSHMSIGTACPSDEELKLIPHHGYGIIDPAEKRINAAFFIAFAKAKIAEIQQRNKRPILVGGTGLYLRALRYGMSDVPTANKEILENLETKMRNLGAFSLYEELKEIDPKTAKIVKPQDSYRIIRALEIFYTTKEPPSALRKSFYKGQPKIQAHWIYKCPNKQWLHKNIKFRVHQMYSMGLLKEAASLRLRLKNSHWALEVMGYKEALLHLDGHLSLQDAMDKTIIRHRQYAKRQYTWFNKENFFRFVISN